MIDFSSIIRPPGNNDTPAQQVGNLLGMFTRDKGAAGEAEPAPAGQEPTRFDPGTVVAADPGPDIQAAVHASADAAAPVAAEPPRGGFRSFDVMGALGGLRVPRQADAPSAQAGSVPEAAAEPVAVEPAKRPRGSAVTDFLASLNAPRAGTPAPAPSVADAAADVPTPGRSMRERVFGSGGQTPSIGSLLAGKPADAATRGVETMGAAADNAAGGMASARRAALDAVEALLRGAPRI